MLRAFTFGTVDSVPENEEITKYGFQLYTVYTYGIAHGILQFHTNQNENKNVQM